MTKALQLMIAKGPENVAKPFVAPLLTRTLTLALGATCDVKENVNQLLVSISGIVTILVAVWIGFEAYIASGSPRLLSDVNEETETTITLATSVVVGSWPYLSVIGGVVAIVGILLIRHRKTVPPLLSIGVALMAAVLIISINVLVISASYDLSRVTER